MKKKTLISSKDRENVLYTNVTRKMKLNFKRSSFCNLACTSYKGSFQRGERTISQKCVRNDATNCSAWGWGWKMTEITLQPKNGVNQLYFRTEAHTVFHHGRGLAFWDKTQHQSLCVLLDFCQQETMPFYIQMGSWVSWSRECVLSCFYF